MSVQRISSRYAKALIDLAKEKGQVEAVFADIQLLAATCKNRDFYAMLKSPIIPVDKKDAVMKALFAGKMSPLMEGYLKLVVAKSREEFLPEIAADFIAQYKVLNGITSVTLTTAQPLSGASVEAIKAKLVSSGTVRPNVELTTKTDADLIGGFVLEFDNKLFDASVAHKLQVLKSDFSKNLYVREM